METTTQRHERDLDVGSLTKIRGYGDLERRRSEIQRKFREVYQRRTYEELGAASLEQTMELMMGVAQIRLDENEIMRWEKDWASFYVPAMESAHKLYHQELMDTLLKAYNEHPRAISLQNVHEWSRRFKNPNVHYKDKEKFIRQKLPTYIKNWKKVASARRKVLKNPALKLLATTDIIELPTFLDENAFLTLHYDERVGLVAKVEAALAALAKGETMPALFQKAKARLEHVADVEKLISKSSVGVLLKKMFSGKQNPETIREFIDGTGNFSIERYIDKCRSLKDRYDQIEHRREVDGSPRSFHFVQIEVFLDWSYPKRKAYVGEAEKRFGDIKNERYDFLQIRHALDAKNWQEAEELMAEARMQELNPKDQEKLESMEKYLHEHRGTPPKQESQEPTNEAILSQMRGALASVPSECVRDLLQRAMGVDYQTLWVTGTCLYNRDWCWRHNYLDEDREVGLKENAKDETLDHIREGHGWRRENNDMTGDTAEGAAARQSHESRSAQFLHIDKTSNSSLIHDVVRPNKFNRSFWYWTSFLPEDLSIEQHRYIIYSVLPILKRGMRTLEKRGIAFTPSGPSQKMQRSTYKETAPDYAMAA